MLEILLLNRVKRMQRILSIKLRYGILENTKKRINGELLAEALCKTRVLQRAVDHTH